MNSSPTSAFGPGTVFVGEGVSSFDHEAAGWLRGDYGRETDVTKLQFVSNAGD